MGEARRKVVNMKQTEDVTQPDAIPIPAEQYWEFRCRVAEHNALIANQEQVRAESKARLDVLGAAVGLDPARGYRLDDATLSATVIPVK